MTVYDCWCQIRVRTARYRKPYIDGMKSLFFPRRLALQPRYWVALMMMIIGAACGGEDGGGPVGDDADVADLAVGLDARDLGRVDLGMDAGPLCPNICDDVCVFGEDGSADCNGQCDAAESLDSPDCDGLCEPEESGVDCNGQ